MMKRADAAGAVAERPSFGELYEILDILHRERWIDDQHERHAGDERNQG